VYGITRVSYTAPRNWAVDDGHSETRRTKNGFGNKLKAEQLIKDIILMAPLAIG
jgi:hypothetical protein